MLASFAAENITHSETFKDKYFRLVFTHKAGMSCNLIPLSWKLLLFMTIEFIPPFLLYQIEHTRIRSTCPI